MSFQCHLCGKGYTNKFNFEYHYAHHFDDRPFACSLGACSSAYKTKADLRQHEKSHEKALGIKFNCAECKTVFDSSTKLNVHKRDFHTFKETSKWCELCNRNFVNLRNHNLTVHENIRRFSCDLDGKRFARLAGLVRHIEQVHLKLSPFPCEKCSKQFKEASALKKHLRTHRKFYQEQKFPKKYIVNPENCSEDEEILLEKLRFKCGSCSRNYSSNVLLMNHQKRDHASARYICDICGQRFITKPKISLHLEAHQNCHRPQQFTAVKKLYKCGVCKQLISSKSALERHKSNVHFDIYDFMCECCSAKFRDRSSLTRHQNLKHHKKTVDTSSDFACPHCGKKLVSNFNFERHIVACQLKQTVEQEAVDNESKTSLTKNCRLKRQVKQEAFDTVTNQTNMEVVEFYAWDAKIKTEHEKDEMMQIEERDQRLSKVFMNQEVEHGQQLIQCKLCPMLLETTGEFKNHFMSSHVAFQNVAFSGAKKLDKPVIIKGLDQPAVRFIKLEEISFIDTSAVKDERERSRFDDIYEGLVPEHSEGEPEDLDENDLSLMFQGETFSASTNSFDCKICFSEFDKLELLKFHCVEMHRISKFKCNHCNFSFESHQAMQVHWKNYHAKDGLFKNSFNTRKLSLPTKDVTCEHCGKILSTRISLKRHIHLVHNSDRTDLFCDLCAESFKDVRKLRKHFTKRHTDLLDTSNKQIIRRRKTTKQLNCEDCGEEVFGQIGLAQHWWNSHMRIKIIDKTRYHCLICRQVMKTRATAMRHYSQVHQDGKILLRTCQVCKMDFQHYEELKSHIELYHVMDNICLICGVGFDTNFDLFNHSKLHRAVPENEKKLECDLCGFRAQQKKTVEVHMSKSHGATRKSYAGNTCEYCGVFFKCYQSFYHHLKHSHSKLQASEFKCHCGKTYKNSRDWRNHELVHFNPEEKQFICRHDGCGRQYSSYCSFKGHIKFAHESHRNQCRICRENFQSRNKLITHLELVHAETRKFKCYFCQKSFKTQAPQLKHMKVCANLN